MFFKYSFKSTYVYQYHIRLMRTQPCEGTESSQGVKAKSKRRS